MLKRAFTEHPASVGETYFQHMGMAFGFGSKMVVSGLACLLHGVFPFLFTTTGKDCIKTLHDRMVVNRSRIPTQDLATLSRPDNASQAAE
ncbi:MAG: DUF6356 family protein [Pseudomonadota bacterium]